MTPVPIGTFISLELNFNVNVCMDVYVCLPEYFRREVEIKQNIRSIIFWLLVVDSRLNNIKLVKFQFRMHSFLLLWSHEYILFGEG